MEETYKTAGFENCVGFVDGTPCVLEYRPTERGDEFFTRKGNYAIQTMAACDHERRITYIETGFYGRRHDANIFRRSLMGKTPSDYFKAKEYILGDSAYPLEQYLVTPFRQNSTGLSKRHKDFNFHHSRVRMAIENCFGIMKMRFQSLRGMPNQLKEQSMIINPNAWIMVCAVLHNMLLGEHDSIVEEAEEQVRRDLSTSEDVENSRQYSSPATEHREILADAVLKYNAQN
ncbi:hypothetical protein G6F56_004499 [Rhizopus delemar]|nr:hypothetical protein G6F56_004499 [Rhizopus delemar]